MGIEKDPLYQLWGAMKRRCYDSKQISYRYYGGRGITVCERWRSSFLAFKSDMGPRPEGATLDRIDGSKNYEPSNCRWATITQQNRNKGDTLLIELDGSVKPMSVWAKERGLSPTTVHDRIRKQGLTPQQALTLPITPRNARRKGNIACEIR